MPLLRRPRSISPASAAIATLLLPACFPLLFGAKGACLGDLFLLGLGLAAFFCLPGLFLLRLLGVRVNGVELALLSLMLGIGASNAIYVAASSLDLGAFYPAWPIAAGLGLVRLTLRQRSSVARVALAPHALFLLLVLAIILPTLCLPHFAQDFIPDRNGVMRVSSGRFDSLLHIPVVNELTHTFPPTNPTVAGKPLTYHYGMDLVAAVLCRFLGVPAPDACLRFLPVLSLTLLFTAAYCFSRRWLRSARLGLLVAVLVVVGSDLSFVPGWLRSEDQTWIAYYFQVPTTFTNYWVNPMALALGFLFAGLLCVQRAILSTRLCSRFTFVAAFLLATMTTIKVFTGAHALLALAGASILSLLRGDRTLPRILLIASVAVFVVAGPMVLPHSRESVVELRFDLLTRYLPQFLERVGWARTPSFSPVISLFERRGFTFLGAALCVLVVLPLYMLGALGALVIATRQLACSLWAWRTEPPLRVGLALFVVSGILTLFTRVTPIDFPASYNNSVWFFVESKAVAWLFVGDALKECRRRWGSRGATATAGLVLLLAAPASAQFFQRVSSAELLEIPNDARAVALFLGRSARNGTVVLADREVSFAVLALARCRVPHLDAFTESFLRAHEIRERSEELDLLTASWAAGDIRKDIVAKYGIEYIVSRERSRAWKPFFSNETYHVYAVAAPP